VKLQLDDREERTTAAPDCELRVEAEPEKQPRLEGYAAPFNALSVDMMGFRERILPGAFRESLERDDIFAVWNHEPSDVLGRKKAQTLELAEDARGLRVVIHPPRTALADSWVESVRRGDVTQMSFAFRTLEDRWIYDEGKIPIRELQRVQLLEVSPTIFPAYPQTKIAARAVAASAALRGLPIDPRLLTELPAEPELRALLASQVSVFVRGPDTAQAWSSDRTLRDRLALEELEAA